jgi:hypothetical protein
MLALMNALPLFLFMCVLLVVEDSSLPNYLRLLAGSIFGFPAEEPDKFYRRYRAKRKGRLIFGFFFAVGVGVARGWAMPIPIQATAIVVAVAGYGGLIIFDMFRSRPSPSNS